MKKTQCPECIQFVGYTVKGCRGTIRPHAVRCECMGNQKVILGMEKPCGQHGCKNGYFEGDCPGTGTVITF